MGLRHFRRHSTAVFDHPVEFDQFAHGMNFCKPENDNEINRLKIFVWEGRLAWFWHIIKQTDKTTGTVGRLVTGNRPYPQPVFDN
jgi:hypothetical protein